MVHVLIEMLRNGSWQVRQHGLTEATEDDLVALLPAYCDRFPHRITVDGVLLAEVTAPRHFQSTVTRF